jgi:nitrite reductase/ring-hydroxylating ferredoxin subunit
LIRSKDDKIRAFHNVCRHRAYTITRKESGTSTVLGCRYHGWSYDTTGRLVKAPQFEGIPGFDKSENSLFEIHTHTTDHGWVFVNLDAGNPAPFPDSTALDLDSFASTARLGSKSEWIAGQTLTGSFNWKFGSTFAKSSPVLPNIDLITIVSSQYCTDITTQLEETLSAAAPLSFAAKFIKIITQHNSPADSQLFPASLLYSFKDAPLWVSFSFFPASESTTNVRYDLFNLSSKTGINENELAHAAAESIKAVLHKIETDFQSVTAGSVANSFNTHQIVHQIREHARLEKQTGGQILPAMRQPKGSSLFQQAEQRKILDIFLHFVNINILISLQGNRLCRLWLWIGRWIGWARLVMRWRWKGPI